MKTRGLLTLGVAALAGLALAVLAAHSAGPGASSGASRPGAGNEKASIAGASARGSANSTRSVPLIRAAATGIGGVPSGDTLPVPAPPGIADVPDANETPAAATTAVPPTPAPTSDATASADDQIGSSITIKKDAVIGVRLDRAITTEIARVEDRVTARVARDVVVDDRPALAAGTCVQGHVAIVERGARATDRVRVGIRFTTISLADGRVIPLQAETIFRDSDPDDDTGATSSRAALSAFLAGAMTRPARAHPVPPNLTRRDVRIPAGSLLTMKLTAPVVIER